MPKKDTNKKLKITLTKSTIGCLEKQKKTIEALGLKKIRQFVIHSDSESLRGMLFVVKHLVTIEEVI
ncbi:MAG: 50S ribosomal protein L30 [Firmicutes bacterium]|nr:50S ribosomal protein L30 [Bacillota bacterium]